MPEMKRKRRRSRKPKFSSKEKVTKRITTRLDKAQWVSGSKCIKDYRDKLLEAQGGVCAILGQPVDNPCLDHDHYDGKCRGVIDSDLNMFEGSVQKLWDKHVGQKSAIPLSEALRRLADYLEKDNSNMMFHGAIVADLKTALKRRTKETIVRNARDNLGIDLDISLDKAELIVQYIQTFTTKLEENYLYEK